MEDNMVFALTILSRFGIVGPSRDDVIEARFAAIAGGKAPRFPLRRRPSPFKFTSRSA
jgi:hypothetical protein